MDRLRDLRSCAPYKVHRVGFPDGFVRDPEAQPFKGMMVVLCDFLDAQTGFGTPTYRALSAATGLKKWRIRQQVRGLSALGYVDVTQRPGNGLEYRLKGGPLRFVFKDRGGTARPHPPVQHDHTPPVQHDHTPPVQHDHTPPVQHDHTPRYSTTTPDDLIDDDDLIEFIKTKYGIGAADAAAIAHGMPAKRLRTIIAYVEANPNIEHPDRYLLAALTNERKKPRKPPREQLPFTPPTSLENKRAAALAEPPPEASWTTPEERERSLQAAREAKERAFPRFAGTQH